MSMSKLEKEFSNETNMRLLKLENTLEEFMSGVSEENLRLQIPYTTDLGGNGLGFSMPDTSTKILQVYVGKVQIGTITLN